MFSSLETPLTQPMAVGLIAFVITLWLMHHIYIGNKIFVRDTHLEANPRNHAHFVIVVIILCYLIVEVGYLHDLINLFQSTSLDGLDKKMTDLRDLGHYLGSIGFGLFIARWSVMALSIPLHHTEKAGGRQLKAFFMLAFTLSVVFYGAFEYVEKKMPDWIPSEARQAAHVVGQYRILAISGRIHNNVLTPGFGVGDDQSRALASANAGLMMLAPRDLLMQRRDQVVAVVQIEVQQVIERKKREWTDKYMGIMANVDRVCGAIESHVYGRIARRLGMLPNCTKLTDFVTDTGIIAALPALGIPGLNLSDIPMCRGGNRNDCFRQFLNNVADRYIASATPPSLDNEYNRSLTSTLANMVLLPALDFTISGVAIVLNVALLASILVGVLITVVAASTDQVRRIKWVAQTAVFCLVVTIALQIPSSLPGEFLGYQKTAEKNWAGWIYSKSINVHGLIYNVRGKS